MHMFILPFKKRERPICYSVFGTADHYSKITLYLHIIIRTHRSIVDDLKITLTHRPKRGFTLALWVKDDNAPPPSHGKFWGDIRCARSNSFSHSNPLHGTTEKPSPKDFS